MNLKKSFLVALAGATAVAMTGVVASAADLGQSKDSFVAETGVATEGTVLLNNDVALSFSIAADVVENGTEVVFKTTQIADDEKKYEDAIKATGIDEVFDYAVMDLSFENADGEDLGLTNITLSLSNGDFNAVFVVEEDGKLTKLDLKDGSFVAPHFSTYVFAKVSESTNTPVVPSNPQEPTTPGVTTGDNAMTTMLIFAGVAAVSFGAVIVASKARKSK